MIKAIPGYKFYSISDNGVLYYKGKEKSVSTNKLGYKKASMGLKRSMWVHRLVALTYLGDIEGKVVMHLDDNPSNNCIKNLRIGTTKDNTQDMMSKGRGYLSDKMVINDDIVYSIKSGVSTKEIVEKYGIHRNTVLFWKKRLGLDSKRAYDMSFITNVINHEGSNIKVGKKFGVSDVTVMRWKRKYKK